MAHGTQDYGNVQQKKTTYRLDDMGELAERIGAVQSIDRLGDVIFIDNFEDGLCKWNKTETGVGTTIGISGMWSEHGGFSVKIHLPADAAAQAILQHSISFPVSGMLGFEFNSTSDADAASFIGYIDFYTSFYRIRYGMKFDVPNGNVYLINPLGAWQLVSSGVLISYSNGIFHKGKLVIDLPNLTYKKYATMAGTVNLSSYSPYITPDLTKLYMSISLIIDGSAGGEIDGYIDSVIVTQNEP